MLPPLLRCSFAPSLFRSVALRSVAPSLFALSLFCSIHSSLQNYSFFYLLFSILIYRIIHVLAWDAPTCWQCSGICWIAAAVPAVRQRGR